MRLLNIRLHPFGGTNDRAYNMREGLNVIEGPNEHGKSTLREALWHALHTPTNLTPKKLRDTMGPWYPLPEGDHARVSITFEADGKSWELDKTWGAGGSSRLAERGGAALADPGRVQEQLAVLLALNEATWKQVLFTGQAELARTVESLRDQEHDVDDVEEFLAGPAAIPGDMSADRLRQAVNNWVDKHYQRWDRDMDRPENGRGVENPWSNNLGPIVTAYYNQERTRRSLAEIHHYEQDLERERAMARRLQEGMKEGEEFVDKYKKLQGPLVKRGELNAQLEREARSAKELTTAAKEWPMLQATVDANEKELKRMEDQLGKLKKEQEVAQKHRDSKNFKERYEAVKQAKKALEEAKREHNAVPAVDPEMVRKAERLERTIKELEIQIAAQRLAVSIKAKKPLVATLQSGAGAPEKLELAANKSVEKEVPGKLVLHTGELTLTVKNALEEDVDELLAQHQKATAELKNLLKELGFNNLEAVKMALAERTRLDQRVKERDAAYLSTLGGKSLARWETEVKALQELPKARDLETIRNEQDELIGMRTTARTTIANGNSKLKEWADTYGSTENLIDQQVALKTEQERLTKELDGLPDLPKEFRSVEEFMHELNKHEGRLATNKEELAEANKRLAVLEARQQEHTAEELAERLERQEREFNRKKKEGEALRRIQRTVERVIKQRELGGNLLDGLQAQVQEYFSQLTNGRYQKLTMDGAVPETAIAGNVAIEPARLSQGARGSLALAVRLALAGAYLKDSRGFLLFDDPFVDLDPQRLQPALEAVARFSQEKQVIFFTCHPHHAEALMQATKASTAEVNNV